MRVLARLAVPFVAVSLLSACAVAPRAPVASQGGWGSSSGQPSAYAAYGTITGIEVARDGAQATGTGAVVGGLVGAVIGRGLSSDTTGKYRQRNVATAVGAAVGAAIGHQMERHNNAGGYRVHVQLERGGSVSLEQRDIGDLRVGDRVRVEQDRVVRG